MALMAQGVTPTVGEAAEAADVSRRTAYRYFPTQEQLLTEAVLEALQPVVQQSIDHEADRSDPEARVDALVLAVLTLASENESLLRTIIRLTVMSNPGGSTEGASAPRRGYRRIEWIETALAPVRSRLGDAKFERLVSALALCVGIETLLVLRDIRGLDINEVIGVSRWAARSLFRASLEDG